MARISRIEGVADRNPFVPQNRYDPRNRRISITPRLARRDASTSRPTTGAARAAGGAPPRPPAAH